MDERNVPSGLCHIRQGKVIKSFENMLTHLLTIVTLGLPQPEVLGVGPR